MEHREFIQSILDDPDRDIPRLVYADWLSENGDPEQAEFVRVQIELAKLPQWHPRKKDLELREDQLFMNELNWRRWTSSLPPWFNRMWGHLAGVPFSWVTFRRGFAQEVMCGSQQWLKASEEFLSAAPIDTVRFLWDCKLDEWCDSHSLRKLRRIELDDGFHNNEPVEAVARLAACTNLPALRDLSLSFVEYVGDRLQEPIQPSESNQCLRHLASSPILPQLESLCLRWSRAASDGLRELCNSNLIINLRELDLSGVARRINCFVFEDFESLGLLRSRLRVLRLRSVRLRDDGIKAMLRGPILETLEELYLDNGWIQNLGPQDQFEDEHSNRLTAEGIRHLVGHGGLSNVRALDLGSNFFGDEGARLLLESPNLEKIEYLGLASNNLSQAIKDAETPNKSGLWQWRVGN